MSEWIGVFAAMLSLGTPLVIAASGESVLERTGILNIGLEGMMLSGAFVGFCLSYFTGIVWIGVLGGISVGVLLALFSSVFLIRFAADQIVVGTGINLLCLGITSTLTIMLFGKTGKLISAPGVPKFGNVLSLDVLMALAICVVIGAWFLMRKTKWGLVARGCGDAPDAVEAAGFSVSRIRTQAFVVAGATAGLAGAYLSLAQTSSFVPNMTAGRGFLVIAAVTFGRWMPVGSALACLLIAFALGLQSMTKALNLPIPYQLFDAMPYLVSLAVLIFVGKGSSAPATLGVPRSSK